MSEGLSHVLTTGRLQVEGRIAQASNAAFLCRLDGTGRRCIYKPVRGERPLWDFPSATLGHREVAAYELSRLAGWDVVPTTVWRDDGPFGPGTCQQWIESTGEQKLVEIIPADWSRPGWHDIVEGETTDGAAVRLVHADRVELQQIALLDAVANNADRKGGHVLVDSGGHVWAIDHGVCFHAEHKLRTVLWGWAGAPIDDSARQVLSHLAATLESPNGTAVHRWLADEESAALAARIERLLESARFPEPTLDWPMIPWPVL